MAENTDVSIMSSLRPNGEYTDYIQAYDAIQRDLISTPGVVSELSFTTLSHNPHLPTAKEYSQRSKELSQGNIIQWILSIVLGWLAKISSHGLIRYCYASIDSTIKLPKIKLYQMVLLSAKVIQRDLADSDEKSQNIHKFEKYSYPPSPISNLIVIPILHIRSNGEFIITKGSGYFLQNPNQNYDASLLNDLNNLDLAPGTESPAHTIAEAARLLFSYEQDFHQDQRLYGWVRRESHQQGDWGLISQQTLFYDGYTLQSLIESYVFNNKNWSNYPHKQVPWSWTVQNRKDYLMDKYFFLGITPYRDSTLIILHYPTISEFGPNSELQSVNLQLGWVIWIVNGIMRILGGGERTTIPDKTLLEEVHPYKSLVNTVRVTKFSAEMGRYNQFWNRLWNRLGISGSGNYEMKQVNLPIPPLEYALQDIEK